MVEAIVAERFRPVLGGYSQIDPLNRGGLFVYYPICTKIEQEISIISTQLGTEAIMSDR